VEVEKTSEYQLSNGMDRVTDRSLYSKTIHLVAALAVNPLPIRDVEEYPVGEDRSFGAS
jgi:hypothetical protein